MIRDACPGDSAAIARIYNHYIARTLITFEEEEISTRAMADRIAEVQADSLPWLAAEATGYLDPECLGRGYGSRLYERLFALLRELGMHTVIGGIALPNSASVALHEKFGMKKVARFEIHEAALPSGVVMHAQRGRTGAQRLDVAVRPPQEHARMAGRGKAERARLAIEDTQEQGDEPGKFLLHQ